MRDELEEARGEVRGLAQHLQAAEGKIVEAEKSVQRERRAHKELEDEANQWRRYALR
jgi:chromosome segregation ATPase